MATTDDLILRMKAQGARQAARDVDKTSKSVRQLDKRSNVAFRSFTKLGGGLRAVTTGAVAFGVAGGVMAGVLAKKSVTAASDLNEVLSKTQVIFRGSAPAIIRWSQTTAGSLGLSQKAALEAASGMGNLLVPMGLARKTAGKMSKRMVQLAGDMASFNNASPEETLGALQSAFIGEYDPVQRFGAAITAARVESEAMRKTHKKNAKDLTAAEKAQAAYNLILKDTKDQQGDFSRPSTGLANAQRRLSAVWEDLNAAVGAPLLDIARKGLNRIIGPLTHVTNVARDVFSDKELNWQQRFRILGASIRHWFGPIADDMIAALKAAHLDQKLNALVVWASPQISKAFETIAPAAAAAFVKGFKAAPTWAKILTAGFLLAKLAPLMAAGGAFGAGGSAAGGAFARSMGPAILLGLAAYANQGSVQDALKNIFNPTAPPKSKIKPNPGGRDIKPNHPGGLGFTAPDPGPGHHTAGSPGGSNFGVAPIAPLPTLHTHVHIDGKEVAHAVTRAATKKKAAR